MMTGSSTGTPAMNDLFLCHTGTDKDWTEQLGELLEEHQIGNRPIKVFFDKWDIDYGTNIIAQIDKGLRESRYVGLVLSPAMLKADWPTAEWQSQVMDDPAGKRGRILPLLLHKFDPESGAPIELPFVLKALKRFDFSEPKRFQTEFDNLLRKLADLPPLRGTQRQGRKGLGSAITAPPAPGQEAPDAVEEALPNNLFPVVEVPEFLFSDTTHVAVKKEVWDNVKGTTPPFFLYTDRLYSFVPHDAKRNVLKPFLSGKGPKREKTTEWLSDPDKARQVIGLLNAALRQRCYELNIWTAKTARGLFYPPIFGDAPPRTFTWGIGKPRTLAIMHESKKEGGAAFGVHMAARMRFILLGTKIYLLVEPAWMFTTDGIKAVEGKEMGVFSTKWGGREKNPSVLRNVLMWGLLIAEGKREIELNLGTKATPILAKVRSVPSHTKINVGIFGDKIRLDRILSGEGAGEQRVEAKESVEGPQELEEIANLALLGEPTDDGDGEQAMDDLDDKNVDGEELRFRF